MDGKEVLCGRLNEQYRKWRRINRWIDRFLLSVLLFLTAFAGSGLVEGLAFLEKGIEGVKYHSFSQLKEINPDTVAWLTLNGTHIDHPVVRSADNFDYLDKGFDGRFYAGGTLFLDKDNSSFEEPYCMIHGHHMAAGAMFGDLSNFLDPDFFAKDQGGTLMTPEYDYDIRVFACGIFNAYDSNVFRMDEAPPADYLRKNSVNRRQTYLPGHILALSTCLDDMTDNRIVVFCELENKRSHR